MSHLDHPFDRTERRVELWEMHASDRLTSAKVRLFIEALREAFAG